MTFDEGDYTHFAPFEREIEGSDPPRLGHDLRAIFRDLAFVRSEAEPGVQVADGLIAVLTRAFNGTLRPEGWAQIGRLMRRWTNDAPQFVALRGAGRRGDGEAMPAALIPTYRAVARHVRGPLVERPGRPLARSLPRPPEPGA